MEDRGAGGLEAQDGKDTARHRGGIADPVGGSSPGLACFVRCAAVSCVLSAIRCIFEANLCPLHKCARWLAEQAIGGRGGDRVREIRRFLDFVAEGTTSGSWKVQRWGLAHFAQ